MTNRHKKALHISRALSLVLYLINDADSQRYYKQQYQTDLHKSVQLCVFSISRVLSKERIIVAAAYSRGKSLILRLLRKNDKHDYQAHKNKHEPATISITLMVYASETESSPPFKRSTNIV